MRTNQPTSSVLQAAAMAMMFLAIVFTIFTFRYSLKISKALAVEANNLNKIKQAGSEIIRIRKMLDIYQKSADRKLPDLISIFSDSFKKAPIVSRNQSEYEIIEGWKLKSDEITLNEASVQTALKTAETAENSTPPWRLTKLVIHSSHLHGKAKIFMRFEGIEKSK